MSTTKGSVPGHPFPYSDHEALTVELRMESHTPPEAGRHKQSKDQDSAAGILLSILPWRLSAKWLNFSPDSFLLSPVGLFLKPVQLQKKKKTVITRASHHGLFY